MSDFPLYRQAESKPNERFSVGVPTGRRISGIITPEPFAPRRERAALRLNSLPRKRLPVPRLPDLLTPILNPYARPRSRRVAVGLPACACLLLFSSLAWAGVKGEEEIRRRGDKETQSTIGNRQSAVGNDVRIETFAPERGYIVGVENVVLLCVARNVGSAPLPENQLRLRCYPISGLDYTNGNLLPVLPTLAPGQAVAYRWRFAPSDARAALVAGVVLERTVEEKRRKGEEEKGKPNTEHPTPNTGNSQPSTLNPQLAFAVVPRLPRPLGLGDVPVLKDPLAHAGEQGGSSLLLNQRVVVRVQAGDRKEPSLVLGVKEGSVWRAVANTISPLRVCVGEDGQIPWWQGFRCQQIRALEDKAGATLTLTGNIGNACRAEITLEARPDTGVLAGKIRLTALRGLRLSGIQLPALMAVSDDKTLPVPRADGTPSLLPDTPVLLPEDARLAASHSGAATFGAAWPSELPFPGWKWNRMPLADGLVTSVLGVQAVSDTRGDTLSAGSSIEVPFRWFAIAPSDTVRDAQRFQIP